MKLRRLIGPAALAAAASLAVVAPSVMRAQEPERVPVHQEPRHHLVYDSAAFRILDIQIPPGDTTLFHTHDTPILYVPIARSRTRGQNWGEEWSGGGAAAATAAAPANAEDERPGKVNSVVGYVEKPLTHRVNNVGASLFRLVGIANRTAGAAAAGDDVSGLSAAPELVNTWYRAHRLVLKPGEATPPHRHAVPVVVVMQTVGTASSESAAWSPLNGPGDIARHEGDGSHVVRNAGAGTIELVEIEVRGAR